MEFVVGSAHAQATSQASNRERSHKAVSVNIGSSADRASYKQEFRETNRLQENYV